MFEFVKLAELYYAGSHGMDIKGPAKAASSRHTKAKVTTRSRCLFIRRLVVVRKTKGAAFLPPSHP